MISALLPLDYCALTDIWKASVKATHDFVSADDIEFYSDRIPRDYMPQMDMYAGHGQWCAFIGLSAEMIEMLFVRIPYSTRVIAFLSFIFGCHAFLINFVAEP